MASFLDLQTLNPTAHSPPRRWLSSTVAAFTVPQRRASLPLSIAPDTSPLLLFVSNQRILRRAAAVATFPRIFLPQQNMSLTNTKTGFSVKDILDLPDTNDEEGSITGAEEDTEGSETASTTKTTGVLVQSPLENVQNLPLKTPFYDSSDNPYTRWLATTDSIQYSCK